jgi:hypothetical protein
MTQILPRYLPPTNDSEKIARILIQVGEPLPDKNYRATAGGDERRLRGIPAIARGVAGAVPGTSPHGSIR